MRQILLSALLGACVGAGIAIGDEVYKLLIRREVSNLSDDATAEKAP